MPVKYRVVFTLLSFILLSAPTMDRVAFAQDDPEKPKSFKQIEFEAADADSDGTISTSEIEAYLNDEYFKAWTEKIDADGDGKITAREFKARRQIIAQLIVSEVDAANVAEAKERRARTRARLAKRKRLTAIEKMNKDYLKKKPRIGAMLGSLKAYDENGKEFDFENLHGKHTVIVFGCLT